MSLHEKVVLVSGQYATVCSGPGTFTNYIVGKYFSSGALDLFTEDVKSDEANVFKLKVPRIILLNSRVIKGFFYYRQIKAYCKKNNIHTVVYNTSSLIPFYHGLFKPKQLKLYVMINDANYIYYYKGIRSMTLYRFIERRVIQYADKVITNSKYIITMLSKHYGVSKDKMQLMYKGIDLSEFPYTEHRKNFTDRIKILFVKTEYKRGGLLELLTALKGIEYDVELNVVGPREDKIPVIKKFAARIGFDKPLNFLGRITRKDLPAVYAANDILCVPSRSEALGVVFLEGLSSGLAVIGTNTGGIPEVTDDGNAGWLVKVNNPADLRNTILEVITNVSARQQKIEHGRQFVQKFSLNNLYESFENVVNG